MTDEAVAPQDEDEAWIERNVKALVDTLARALVDEEEAVEVKVWTNGRRVGVTVHVAKADVGFAVGAQGKNADAMRTIVQAWCRKHRLKVDLDVLGKR